ncbi:MAG: methyltransferase [Pyrinomonadaceae bacterium]
MYHEETRQELTTTPLPESLVQMLTGYWVSQGLYVAAELGVADLLKDGPRHYEDLAAETETHAPTLYRLLRMLADVGVFTEVGEGRFALTALAAYLQTGPRTMRAMARHLGEAPTWQAWGNLLHSVRTGETAFAHTHGAEVFPYYAAHPASNCVFNEAMTNYSEAVGRALIGAYDFSAFATVIDVGGGHGSLLAAILAAYPHLKGVVFDLPPVAEGALRHLASRGLTDRCVAFGGDFFERLPPGGDAYLLKSIIHDWDDERAVALLKNVHRAMPDDGKLLLVETVITPNSDATFGVLDDMHMLVMTGGRARTEAEYRALLAKAGFHLTRIVPTESLVSVIEAERLKVRPTFVAEEELELCVA